MKRAEFIETSVQIRETFGFARPEEILRAVHVYGGHWYGAMLWDLYGDKANQVYHAWSTCVKLTWDVPRSTHTYLVEDVLAKDFLTVKQQLVGRFIGFFRGLLTSQSPEVQIVANMVGRCALSTTGSNLLKINRETGHDPWVEQSWKIQQSVTRAEVPLQDAFRVQYLKKLITARMDKKSKALETDEIDRLIDSLCSS